LVVVVLEFGLILEWGRNVDSGGLVKSKNIMEILVSCKEAILMNFFFFSKKFFPGV
jgi:hypothetical protein